jgi:hypothetical protein
VTVHSPVLQDVVARLDTPSQAGFPRVERGEQADLAGGKGHDR